MLTILGSTMKMILKHNKSRDQIAQANTHIKAYEKCFKSPPLFALSFNMFFFLGSYNAYGMSQLPLPTNQMDYSNLIHSYISHNHNPMTTSNLKLYF